MKSNNINKFRCIVVTIIVLSAFINVYSQKSDSILTDTNFLRDANSQKRDLRQSLWNTLSFSSPDALHWKKADIALVIDQITNNDAVSSKIGHFLFVDLDADGKLELLANIDYSGRNFFDKLIIIRLHLDSFTFQTIDVWNMKSLPLSD